MQFEATPLPGVYLLTPKVFGDERGFFVESWNAEVFKEAGFDLHFVQDNHSRSAQGILRGLHYQTTHTQGKLVRVTAGTVYDVAVDLRRDSPSLGQWYGVTLDAKTQQMLWVPPGFAHGFYVTSEYADFQYKCTDKYDPGSEVSIAWDDPDLAIDWPLVDGKAPSLSGKDQTGMAFRDAPRLA
ncbi:dTDP-4-dehydrorhamnose 3,5-epimerase [Congregibacter sp.]|uniref:dTDP-4-dehydrorhamnose 3,5-epimerase n=1 Tax=Congregibacter sp. TaxID=2744308 RepID=UPI003F6A6BB9